MLYFKDNGILIKRLAMVVLAESLYFIGLLHPYIKNSTLKKYLPRNK